MTSKEQFEWVQGGLLVRAPAKINLSLLIAGKRSDGYHEIETIMAKINLYDELLFEKTDKPGIELICQGKYPLPSDDDNLVIKACRSMGIKDFVKITLTKNIPIGAGLGGGSSDAAATLIGINKLLELGISQAELSEKAANIGSDICFFLGEPLALCRGRGEKIEKIKKKFDFLAFLILSNINVSTKKVYENYRHEKQTYDTLKAEIDGYLLKNKVDLAAKMCANMLEYSCFELNSKLADLKTKIELLNIGSVSLSGSGSSMYILMDNQEASNAIQKLQEDINCGIILVSNNSW